jgi:hypothetical protein
MMDNCITQFITGLDWLGITQSSNMIHSTASSDHQNERNVRGSLEVANKTRSQGDTNLAGCKQKDPRFGLSKNKDRKHIFLYRFVVGSSSSS